MKTTLQKVNQDENHRVMSQIKGQDKAPEKQLCEAEIGKLPVNDSEDNDSKDHRISDIEWRRKKRCLPKTCKN